MRFLIAILVFILSCNAVQAQELKTYIQFERVGNSDKYFEPVSITPEQLEVAPFLRSWFAQDEESVAWTREGGWCRIVRTDSVTYRAICNFIIAYSDMHFTKTRVGGIDCWTCFGVSMFEDKMPTFFHPIETKEKTAAFLNSMFKLLDDKQYDQHLAAFMHKIFDYYRK